MNTDVVYDPYGQFERIEMSNGFNIYYLNVDRPWIKGTFMLNVGNVDCPVGKSGLAHFVEHLVFENHNSMSYQEVSDFFEGYGGFINGSTSASQTQFVFNVPIDTLVFRKTIEIFSNLLLNHTIGNNFEKQKNIINQEINETFPDNHMEYFHAHTQFVFQDTHFKGIKSNLGSVLEFNALSLEDCSNFYTKNYTPQNMSLVLIGNIKPEIKSILSDSEFALNSSGKKKNLIEFKTYSFWKKETIVFNKNEFLFLQKTWKLNFVLDFSIDRPILYIHKVMLYKVLFNKFREELNANYNFSVNVETLQGFHVYSIFFAVNSMDYSQIESYFNECIFSLNTRWSEFLQAKNFLIQGILMADSSFSKILFNTVRELDLYREIQSYSEEIAGYESATFEELQEFNNFLISKSNRYIEIVK